MTPPRYIVRQLIFSNTNYNSITLYEYSGTTSKSPFPHDVYMYKKIKIIGAHVKPIITIYNLDSPNIVTKSDNISEIITKWPDFIN